MHKENTKQLVSDILSRLAVFGEIGKSEYDAINSNVSEAVIETNKIISKYSKISKKFNLLQTHHSAVFFYKLAQLLHKDEECLKVCEKLYLINRMLNGLDLFYKIKMPDFFLIGHGLGTVFSKASYGEYLVVFQNVTIAVQDNYYPNIGDKVVIYPNCVIAGNTSIGKNSVIGAGTVLINKTIPPDTLVYMKDGSLLFLENSRNEIQKYFEI